MLGIHSVYRVLPVSYSSKQLLFGGWGGERSDVSVGLMREVMMAEVCYPIDLFDFVLLHNREDIVDVTYCH